MRELARDLSGRERDGRRRLQVVDPRGVASGPSDPMPVEAGPGLVSTPPTSLEFAEYRLNHSYHFS
jgi:hypothetical protein